MSIQQLREMTGPPAHTESAGDGLTTWSFNAPSGTVRVFSRDGRVIGWSPLDFKFETLRAATTAPAATSPAPSSVAAAAASSATTGAKPTVSTPPNQFQPWDAPPVRRK